MRNGGNVSHSALGEKEKETVARETVQHGLRRQIRDI